MINAKELRYMQDTFPYVDSLVHFMGLFFSSLGFAIQNGFTKTSFDVAERVWFDAYDDFKEALEKDGFSVTWSRGEDCLGLTVMIIEVDWS